MVTLMPGTFTPFFTVMFVYGRGIRCSKLLFTDHYTDAGGAALKSCSVQITYVDILGLPAQLTYQRMFLYSLQGREENLMRPHIRNRELISPSRFQRFVMTDKISNSPWDVAHGLLPLLKFPRPGVRTFTKQFIRAIHKA
jgi:hypothetical protein